MRPAACFVGTHRGVGEVERGGVVVGDDPGEDGVLVHVVVGPAGDDVEPHEVLEVGHLPAPPELREARLPQHLRGAQQLGRGQQGHVLPAQLGEKCRFWV